MASKVLPIVPNPPSANLPTALAAYLLTITDVATYFNNTINDYRRIDYTSNQMAALNIYIIRENYITGPWYLDGDIQLELCLPPVLVRQEIALHSGYASNLLSLHLSTLDLITAVEATNPGLVDIGSRFNWDYKESTGLFSNNKVSAYTVKGTINFRISLLEYYEKIQPAPDTYDFSSVVITPTC